MHQRPPIRPPTESRQFTNRVLTELRDTHFTPRGWATFLGRCGARSWAQARTHPRAAIEICAVHAALLPVARRRPFTLLGSWLLAIAHLGLLEPEARSIGAANALSLLRANLPLGRRAPLIAMATDVADGWLARRRRPSAFGGYADALADVVFWSRFAASRSGPWLGSLAVAAWAAPATAILVASFVSGRAIAYPRPLLVRRQSAVLQCLIAATALAAGQAAREG
ncbi:MAG: CDP-alcohol phosphatidyltransferase family protein [Candidatus Dormiibacterota bacterium]